MRAIILFLLLSCSLFSQAQKSLTGLWTGVLTNDSSTVRRDQSFEIALTQYKEKVYGYSRSSFIVNDTLYYIVKRVKGNVEGDICEVKDDEIIATNFPGRIDKGVRVTTTFRMNKQDTTWHLAGNWKTNKTKHYYALTGGLQLREETNLDNSKIFPHLEELKLTKDVAFYQEAKKPTVTTASPNIQPSKETATNTKTSKKDRREEKNAETGKSVAQVEKQPKETMKETAAAKETKDSPASAKSKALPGKDQAISTPASVPVVAKIAPVVAPPAALVNERTTSAPQLVNFQNDSLVLSLYDNGEIDGDTVSVLLNGELILAKQGLKASAIKKTIFIPAGQTETSLVLYAENLGKYPPNTGLLVVHDGEEVYQIRFSADLKQNAEIIFRRKK